MTILLTDERLRTWLDGNQLQRERLCLALLPLDKRYTHVVPRRLRGGPDGGRDIEAIFEGSHVAWGAVGFRNGAQDSPYDQGWVKKKFSEDVKVALENNATLTHFVFFTNVDLTPTEQAKLRSVALQAGLLHCEIYFRERLRMLLDSPAGLAARYQYLAIDLSTAEQAAFFNHHADLFQRASSQHFDALDRKLARIEFHSECARPTRNIALVVRFNTPMASEEISDLRVLLVAVAESRPEPHPTFCLSVAAGENAVLPQSRSFESSVTIWSGDPPTLVLQGGQTETFPKCDRYVFSLEANRLTEFPRVGDFDRLWLHLYVSQGTLDQVPAIDFAVNNFVIASSELGSLDFEAASSEDKWVSRCLEHRDRHMLLENIDGPTHGNLVPPLVYTDFFNYVPVRLE